MSRGDASELPMVALLGRANVGKSTLFNRLLRNARALVDDRPGVTRDRVVAPVEIEGSPVLLVDTGGLDPEAEAGLPAAVRSQAERVVRDADVILLVVDVRTGLLPLDRDIAELLRRAQKPVVVVANKADGPVQEVAAAEFHTLGFSEVIPASAEHRRGIVDLQIAIATRLPARPDPGPAEGQGEVRVAIVGRPNVGKSSLVNSLVGDAEAIVAEEPGTTRDATDSRLVVNDEEVVLIDTAGLRRPGRRSDRLERGSAHMALRAIQRSDLALLLLDAVEGITDQDAKIARLALDVGRPLLLVVNKWDAVEPAQRRLELEKELDRKLGFVREPEVVYLSARTGQGTGRLLPRALDLLGSLRRVRPTAELNRVLQEAVSRNAPPTRGRKPARFYYATQVSNAPPTILLFVNDPSLVPTNYHRYLESYFRKSLDLRSGPVRIRLRKRTRRGEEPPDVSEASG